MKYCPFSPHEFPDPPRFIQPLQDTVCLLDGLDNLNFTVTGVPYPEILLFKDDVMVDEANNLIKLQKEGDHHQIIFSQSNTSNSGVYKVKAVNLVGEAESSCQLNVQGTAATCLIDLNS